MSGKPIAAPARHLPPRDSSSPRFAVLRRARLAVTFSDLNRTLPQALNLALQRKPTAISIFARIHGLITCTAFFFRIGKLFQYYTLYSRLPRRGGTVISGFLAIIITGLRRDIRMDGIR